MNQYILDFSEPARPRRPNHNSRWARRRMYQRFRRVFVMLSGLVCCIALVGMLRQQAQTHHLRQRYQMQVLQYDSLLAAKSEADRQLTQIRFQLLHTHQSVSTKINK